MRAPVCIFSHFLSCAVSVTCSDRILAQVPAGLDFTPLMTLYLTDQTSAAEIKKAHGSGIVKAVKLYPAGATTNSDSGVTDIAKVVAYALFPLRH
jgi:dihydroorotase